MDGFKEFILRGNVIELAVAVIIGTAFTAIVDSMTKDIITPFIGLIGNVPSFAAYKLGPINIGNFINAIIAFAIKALVVYFLIVKPFAALVKLLKIEKAKQPTDIELLTQIRDILKDNR